MMVARRLVGYTAVVHWTSFASIVLSTAIYGAIVGPALKRYRAWKAKPQRIPVARPNWRGVYVADLAHIRAKRLAWALWGSAIVFGELSLIFILPHGR